MARQKGSQLSHSPRLPQGPEILFFLLAISVLCGASSFLVSSLFTPVNSSIIKLSSLNYHIDHAVFSLLGPDGKGRAYRLGTPQASWVPSGGTVSCYNSLHYLTCVWVTCICWGAEGNNKVGDIWETNSFGKISLTSEILMAYCRSSHSS